MAKKIQMIPRPVGGKKVAKVPVVMQMEFLECGAASLAMILAYYKKFVPLEQVRSDCGISRDGSKAKNIVKAALNYGLNAKAYRYEPDEIQQSGQFPCIIHWNFNHFVVLNGFRKNKAIINDPAKGTVKVSLEEFDKSFTGICLEFEPGESFQPGGEKHSLLGFVKAKMEGTGSAMAFTIATTVILSLIGIIKPAFSRVFIDRLVTGESPMWLEPFVGIMLFVTLLEFLVGGIQAVHSSNIEGKLAIIANSDYMWHILRVPMEFYSQRMAGDIATRQRQNENVAQQLIQTFAPMLMDAAMLVIYLFVMLRYSVALAVVGIAATLINVAVARIISQKRINVTRVQMRDAGKLAGITVTGIEMIETIKASGAENGYYERWAGYQASVNTQNVKYAKINEYLGSLPEIVSALADITVIMLGVYLVLQGEFTVGMITAFQGFMTAFNAPAQKFISSGQKVQEMRTNMERIEDVMDYPADVTYGGEASYEEDSFDKLSGAVEIKNITFGYSRLEKPLIEDFSLSLKPGSRVAFVGSSGCGKSTLAKLISGLYQPWSGEITFDGKTIENINRAVFTGSLAVVDQDVILFEDTVMNNIKMWDTSIEDFEVIMAARDSQMHDDIMTRNGGYQCRVMEGGKNFSGGQRQRIEIAHTLAQDPTIIIMDEATSALDAKTEFEVVKSIKDRGITCIVIAHRLSTIRDCDEIIVMDKGKVVERGTHEELMANGGLYTELITTE